MIAMELARLLLGSGRKRHGTHSVVPFAYILQGCTTTKSLTEREWFHSLTLCRCQTGILVPFQFRRSVNFQLNFPSEATKIDHFSGGKVNYFPSPCRCLSSPFLPLVPTLLSMADSNKNFDRLARGKTDRRREAGNFLC